MVKTHQVYPHRQVNTSHITNTTMSSRSHLTSRYFNSLFCFLNHSFPTTHFQPSMAFYRRDSLAPPDGVSASRSHSPLLHVGAHKDFTKAPIYDQNPSVATQHSFHPQPNFDLVDSIAQPDTHLVEATSNRPTTKQKIMTPSRGRGRGRGHGRGGARGRSTSKGRASYSTTPAPQSATSGLGLTGEGPTPRLKLKLKCPPVVVTQYQEAGEEDEEEGLPTLPLPAQIISRSGRTVHKAQHGDIVQGNEYEGYFDQSSDNRAEDEDDYKPRMRGPTRKYFSLTL